MPSQESSFQLSAHPRLERPEGPVVFLVLDGVGIGRGDEFDAVARARTPTLDWLGENALTRSLKAHGRAVGLPSDGDMGNSEVGHNAIGAGRVFDQGAKLVENAVQSGLIWEGAWSGLTQGVLDRGAALHLIGLLSDGNVHSHERHLHAMLRRAKEQGLERVYVHVLLDGRDVPETSAPVYLERLEAVLAECRQVGGDYRIASGGGRMVTTMDRYEADWSVVERGWQAHVLGEGRRFESALDAVESLRAEGGGTIDQFLPSFVIADARGEAIAPIVDGDGVIFFNFRGDRGIEISRAFTEGESFPGFDRQRVPKVDYAGMMLYDGDEQIPAQYLVAPPAIDRTMGEYLARNGVSQFACSETQKYGHVTYFWNGNRSGKFDKGSETYLEIPSDLVPFEERPWMKAAECADAAIEAIRSGKHRFIRINFAGGDMVGHTGHLEASTIAVEAVDLGLSRILPVVREAGGVLVVTADHGNADEMVEYDKKGGVKRDESGRPKSRTSHSLNPVPFHLIDFAGRSLALRGDLDDAGLSNIAATLIELLGFEAPAEYDPSLLERP